MKGCPVLGLILDTGLKFLSVQAIHPLIDLRSKFLSFMLNYLKSYVS